MLKENHYCISRIFKDDNRYKGNDLRLASIGAKSRMRFHQFLPENIDGAVYRHMVGLWLVRKAKWECLFSTTLEPREGGGSCLEKCEVQSMQLLAWKPTRLAIINWNKFVIGEASEGTNIVLPCVRIVRQKAFKGDLFIRRILLPTTRWKSPNRREGKVILTQVALATFHLHRLPQEFLGRDCPIFNFI